MSVTPEQKMKLMLELGMEDAADKFAEAHSLTTMRFRPISSEKIEELLQVEYQEKIPFNVVPVIAVGLVGLVAGAFLSFRPDPKIADVLHFSWTWFLIINAITQAIGWSMGRSKMETHTADVCQMPLKEWDDNLPYGALLSVKEAKQQGYKDFTIFFPAKDDSEYAEIKRLKADPIIVAHKKGHGKKVYNIFAWDDGKVYE
jgi:hypothetical protein